MPYLVDEGVIAQASECSINKRCQSDAKSSLCGAAAKISSKALIVYCQGRPDCNYRTAGTRGMDICSCPVRNEIFRRYRK